MKYQMAIQFSISADLSACPQTNGLTVSLFPYIPSLDSGPIYSLRYTTIRDTRVH